MQQAILIIGPTGSGKSPLGDHLEAEGINSRPCHHFDFGDNLRAAARGELPGFSPKELAFLHDVLEKGALLEDETFYIAEKILTSFCTIRQIGAEDLLILNGLPRHAGQATNMAKLVSIGTVIRLDCTPEIVCERLQSNTGGDRTERDDDDLDLVRQKLATFQKRTRPLLDYYRERGARTVSLTIGVDTQPADLIQSIRSAV